MIDVFLQKKCLVLKIYKLCKMYIHLYIVVNFAVKGHYNGNFYYKR